MSERSTTRIPPGIRDVLSDFEPEVTVMYCANCGQTGDLVEGLTLAQLVENALVHAEDCQP